MQTPKQQKLIKLLMDNYGLVGESKTFADLMVEAGYSKETAKNPKLILESEGIREGLSDFLSDLDSKRKMALRHITEAKLQEARPSELAHVIDSLTRNHQLLSGGSTENVFSITWEK